jgi:hypothetical protein
MTLLPLAVIFLAIAIIINARATSRLRQQLDWVIVKLERMQSESRY